MKKLEEMSLEELWQLFPIELVDHNDEWYNWYKEEENNLINLFKPIKIIITHIGSSAIPNIKSKPIVDILFEIDNDISYEDIKSKFIDNGYICMSETMSRMSFNKGYTINGYTKKVYHIHVRRIGDNDEIYFKNYLLNNPDIAKEYEKLKLTLASKYKYNRDEYTKMKSNFIMKYTKLAKK